MLCNHFITNEINFDNIKSIILAFRVVNNYQFYFFFTPLVILLLPIIGKQILFTDDWSITKLIKHIIILYVFMYNALNNSLYLNKLTVLILFK